MTDPLSPENPEIVSDAVLAEKGFGTEKTTDYHDNHRKELENDAIKQLISHKENYSKKAYYVVLTWLIFIGLILFLTIGSKFLPIFLPTYFNNSFSLISDKVLIALIGGTTASVVGLFAIILRGTFNNKLIEALSSVSKKN